MEKDTSEAPERTPANLNQQMEKIVRAKQPGEALAELFRELPGFYYNQSSGPNPRFRPTEGIRIERAFGLFNQRGLTLTDYVDPIVQQATTTKHVTEYLTNLARAAVTMADDYPDKNEFSIHTDEGVELYEDRLCDFYTRLEWELSDTYHRHPEQNFAERVKTLGRTANEVLLATLVKGRFTRHYTKNSSDLAWVVDDWIEVLIEKSDFAQA